MKLCVLANLYGSKTLDETLARLKSLGVEAVEIGAGGYPGKAHCNPAELLADEAKFNEFKATIDKYGLEVAALACHGNPVHPDKATAKMYDEDFKNAVLLAEKIGVDTVITFSGCPGDCAESKNPNWVTCAWPEDYAKILDWQWNEVLIPYWKEKVKFCASHGVSKIALELHPGFMCYNPTTLLRLREAVGDVIGANLDPSHLFWQGIEITEAIKLLGKAGAIHHFHAKDTRIDPANVATRGVLDTESLANLTDRSWIFRTVGYGHDAKAWKDIFSILQSVGYQGAISIEHEDGLMSPLEGLEKAIDFLKPMIIRESAGAMWWA